MRTTTPRPQPEVEERRAEDLLDGWKAIADYLNRTERTVQRWEKSKALPIRRFEADSPDEQPRVFAYRSEIDAWWKRQTRLDPEEPGGDTIAGTPDSALADNGKNDFTGASSGFFERYTYLLTMFVLGLALVAVGLRIVWPRIQRVLSPQSKLVLAVVPFQNSSGDVNTKNVAGALTDELISRIARLHPEQLAVVEITTPDSGLSVEQIGRKFHADYVLKGEVRRADRQIAINSQLVSVREHQVVWGFSERSEMREVIDFEIRVAGAIVGEVLNVLPGKSHPPREVSQETYEAYLTGRALWNRRTTDSLKEAAGYFQQAIKFDPKYAPAYAGLADCYSLLGTAPYTALPPKESFPKAKAAAQQALQIDDTLAEAHLALGYAELVYDWNYPEAEKALRRSLELRPNSATAHQYYAYYLTAMGELDKAIQERRNAQELQSDSPLFNTALGEAYYQARQFDNAIEQTKKSLILDPSYPVAWINMGRAYEQKGMHSEALKIYQKIQAVVPGEPAILALIGNNYAVTGKKDKAQAVISQLRTASNSRYVPSLYIALIYVGLGQKDDAFRWLDKAYDERCEYLVYLPTEPMADPLRSDPRFTRFLGRLGLTAPKIPASASSL